MRLIPIFLLNFGSKVGKTQKCLIRLVVVLVTWDSTCRLSFQNTPFSFWAMLALLLRVVSPSKSTVHVCAYAYTCTYLYVCMYVRVCVFSVCMSFSNASRSSVFVFISQASQRKVILYKTVRYRQKEIFTAYVSRVLIFICIIIIFCTYGIRQKQQQQLRRRQHTTTISMCVVSFLT